MSYQNEGGLPLEFVGSYIDPAQLGEVAPGVVAVVQTSTSELEDPKVGAIITLRSARMRLLNVKPSGAGWLILSLVK